MGVDYNGNISSGVSADGSTVHSNHWSDDFVLDSITQRLFIAILICIVTVIGIPGNGLVLLAVMLSRKLQNKTNIFVVNLACADMLTCTMLPFQALSLFTKTWPLPSALCTTVATFTCLSLGSSVVNLAFIAFVRYAIITKSPSFNDRMFTKTNLAVLVCQAWFIPLFLIVMLPAIGVGAIGYSERYKICTAVSSHPLSDTLTLTCFFVLSPCLVIIVSCYVKIYQYVRNSGRNLNQFRNRSAITKVTGNSRRAPPNSTEVAIFRRQVRVTKNLFIVVCTYVICVMPFGIGCAIPAPIYPLMPWAYLLYFMNSCLNPFIYGFKHPQFKEVFWAIMTCSWCNIPEPSFLITSFR